jgi:PEP-CTERM motif
MTLLRRFTLLLGLAALVSGAAPPAHADPILPTAAVPGSLWYNGDLDGRADLANQRTISGTILSNVYDDFIVPAGRGWDITAVYSNNHPGGSTLPTITGADFSIRQGVSSGNGGTVVASGSGLPVTVTPTGRNLIGQPESTFLISGLHIHLDPGTYFLNVTPVSVDFPQTFETTTSGLNAVGMPPGNDGNSFWNSPSFGQNFSPTTAGLGSGTWDFSEGVVGTVTPPPTVPEPSSLALLSLGGLGLAGWRRWKKKATA